MRTRFAIRFALLILALPVHAASQSHWVAAWGASPSPQLPDQQQIQKAKLAFQDQTLREIVYPSISGDTIRVRLSNAFGSDTVDIASARVALRKDGSSIDASTDRPLTFSGRMSVSIPPNALVLSDPVKLNVTAGAALAISLYLPKPASGAGIHYAAQQTNYVSPGDQTKMDSLTGAVSLTSWVFLAAVDILAPESTVTVVAFGDSITDGARSTLDANHRWPDFLAARLRTAGKKIAVIDAGIGGNRILHDAKTNVAFGVNGLARYDRDVLAQPGVRYIIVLEGINDLGHPGSSAPLSETVSADDIIAGLRQYIERAHERGIKIFGATLTPFEGTPFNGYYTAEKEARRKAVNHWIRTSKAFDGVVDFEKAVRDPKNPDRMLPAYDGGDHLHPGDAGYKAMGEAIDLSLFR